MGIIVNKSTGTNTNKRTLKKNFFLVFIFKGFFFEKVILITYATYNNKNAIIRANSPVASEKANPKIA